MRKIKKTKGMYFKFSPEENTRLNAVTKKLDISNSQFFRVCIELFWVSMQVEKGLKTGKMELYGEMYNLDLSEIALIQQEMAQILTQERWEDIITQQAKSSLKRLKRPISIAS